MVGPKLTYSLARISSAEWRLAAPVQAKADAAKAQQLAASLKNLRATRFASEVATADDLKRYGLDHASFTVNLTLGKQETQKTLVLAQVKEGGVDHVYVKRAADAWIAEVPASIAKDLDLSVMDLTDKTILDFKQQDAVSLLFTVGPNLSFGADRHRTKTDGGYGQDSWTMSAPALGEAKRWKASSVLSTLESIKGLQIVADSATPIADARLWPRSTRQDGHRHRRGRQDAREAAGRERRRQEQILREIRYFTAHLRGGQLPFGAAAGKRQRPSRGGRRRRRSRTGPQDGQALTLGRLTQSAPNL